VSIWLGPPDSQKRMTARGSRDGCCVEAWSRSVSASDSPAKPASPVCKNQRREPTRSKSKGAGIKLFTAL
jgi:hypothetical protein